jgi:putative phosphoribosyl transferase
VHPSVDVLGSYGERGRAVASAEDLDASAAVALGHPWPTRTQDILSKLELRPTPCGCDADGGLSTALHILYKEERMIKEHVEDLVHVPIGSLTLEGALVIPERAQGLVLFAHGSGSSRHSPRNNFVARVLHAGGLGTLLIDLLTEKEDEVYETRFDINLLTKRLLLTTQWLQQQSHTSGLPIGYFGASTGAAAALKAAAAAGSLVQAVVSRGGRPDLAEPDLADVRAATLLMVGGEDDIVIDLNRQAYERLQAHKEMVIIPGATHLFEEPGTLEEVARLATDWFKNYLKREQI